MPIVQIVVTEQQKTWLHSQGKDFNISAFAREAIDQAIKKAEEGKTE